MSIPPEVESRLQTWREAATGISAALANEPGADWDRARAHYDTAFRDMFDAPEATVYETGVVGGRPALIASPAGGADATILHLHGGGYASGSAEGYRAFAGQLAHRVGARVIVPDYRLAPQHPFPAPIKDVLKAYGDLIDMQVDPGMLAVTGDSAGGAMTLTLLRKLGEAGLATPAAAAIFSPWADLGHTGTSILAKADRDPLVRLSFLTALSDAFLGDVDPAHPDASPVRASFEGLPPVLIQAGEREIMLSDAHRLAERLGVDRVRVTLEVWPEMFHVFQLFAGLLPEADAALGRTARFLRDEFAPVGR